MKKSQRLRYYALMSKGSTLTADEQAELKTLQDLVAKHPDASKDEDDVSGSSASAGGNDDDGEEDEDDGGKDKGGSAKGAKTTKQTTLGQMLAGIVASAKAGKGTAAGLAEATQRIAVLEADLTQARADLAASRASLKTTSGHLSAALSLVGLKAEALAGKTEEEAAASIKTAFTAALTEELGTLGFPSAKLPPPDGGEKANGKAELLKQFNALTDPKERAEFYAKHSAKMFGE